MLMLLMSWAAVALMLRKSADGSARRGVDGLPKIMLIGLVGMTFSGWLATLAGWYTTEIGRQPWLVQGVMTTKQAVADVPAPMVLSARASRFSTSLWASPGSSRPSLRRKPCRWMMLLQCMWMLSGTNTLRSYGV